MTIIRPSLRSRLFARLFYLAPILLSYLYTTVSFSSSLFIPSSVLHVEQLYLPITVFFFFLYKIIIIAFWYTYIIIIICFRLSMCTFSQVPPVLLLYRLLSKTHILILFNTQEQHSTRWFILPDCNNLSSKSMVWVCKCNLSFNPHFVINFIVHCTLHLIALHIDAQFWSLCS